MMAKEQETVAVILTLTLQMLARTARRWSIHTPVRVRRPLAKLARLLKALGMVMVVAVLVVAAAVVPAVAPVARLLGRHHRW
jgi:cadmium resistance protein CadD (predicted permease)